MVKNPTVQLSIAGVDVGRNKVTVCILDDIPDDLKRFKSKYKKLEFKANAADIKRFLALPFDGAILEPTGGHYSRIWAYQLKEAGKVVKWVGHQEIAAYRESWRVFNKSDATDCIALACYGLERWNRPVFFLSEKQADLSAYYQQLQHLNRVKNPIINRLRQQLCHECPEVAEKKIDRPWLDDNPPGLLLVIAQEKESVKWQKIIDDSIGTGISEFSREEARMLCHIERQELEIEKMLMLLLERPEYSPYRQVFDKFSISNRTAIALLTVIFPIRRFLDDGREIREHVTTSNGKRATRNHSLSKFKLACGLGQVWHQSGDTSKWVPGGNSDVREALWRWCKVSVVMTPDLSKPDIAALRKYYEEGTTIMVDGKEKHLDPGVRNQKVMRVVRRMLTSLYKELLSVG
ncbi:MAG: transposase [Scytolyngbya sp. HA4215-MV1]|jgi:hypothetical protein|nr:transposase [Scytolyngbya sp. HA4215-MV1]